jgi:hypothetical protein
LVEDRAEEDPVGEVDSAAVEVLVAGAEGKVGLVIKAAVVPVAQAAEAVERDKEEVQAAARVALVAAVKAVLVAGDSAAGREVAVVRAVVVQVA